MLEMLKGELEEISPLIFQHFKVLWMVSPVFHTTPQYKFQCVTVLRTKVPVLLCHPVCVACSAECDSIPNTQILLTDLSHDAILGLTARIRNSLQTLSNTKTWKFYLPIWYTFQRNVTGDLSNIR